MKNENYLLRLVLFVTFLLSVYILPVQAQNKQDTIQETDIGQQIIPEISIKKPLSPSVLNFSGDGQHQTVNQQAEKPIRALVTDDNSEPVPNFPVYFKVVLSPSNSKNFKVHTEVAYSNSNGIAETLVTLGSKPGEYTITAGIRGNYVENVLVYSLHARKGNWVFMLSIGLVGGLALFLFGMNMMSEGMQRSAGDKMRSILSSLTNNRLIAVGVGAFVTMVIQSSSATTVMLVSFVQSGLMTFMQTLGIILGADIGTTVTAQLIAFKLTDYSLLMVGIGFAMILVSKSPKIKDIGSTVLGFGILFFGMDIMSKAMHPLRTYAPFIELLLKLENPIIGILIGTIFTALIQSSSAFVGIIIVLSTQGLLSLEAGIPLLLGANLGTAITAILASINTGIEAKKVALAHTIFKIIGVLIFVWWIPYFADLVKMISPKGDLEADGLSNLSQVLPRQIANAHTIFNVALTVISLPFTSLLARFINRLLPPVEDDTEELKVKYLDENQIPTPALALNLAKQEVIRMGHAAQDMVNDIILPFFVKENLVIEGIAQKEMKIEFLRIEVNSYIMMIMRQEMPEERTQEAFQIMYTIKEFEQIAEVITQSMIPEAENWIHGSAEFTKAGKKEIMEHHQATQKQISRAIEVFRDVNLKKAMSMKKKYKKYRNFSIELEKQHYGRLKEKVEKSIESSSVHLQLISNLKVITHHATNIARILLEWHVEEKTKKKKKKK